MTLKTSPPRKRITLTISLVTLLLFSSFSFATAPTNELESSMVKRPGYFRSMWDIAKFYVTNRWSGRYIEDRTPNLNSHYEFLTEKRTQNNMGKMTSFFDHELQTRLYYSVTAKPDAQGNIPIVDPTSKGLVMYFHGSGTENGSGSNFNYKGNKLATLGYTSLSMDYPFHQDGPINSKYGNTEFYMKYIAEMIQKYRRPGQPVILVGHSFGVNVISEFITRYPFAADGVVLLSPAGFNEELMTWSREKTTLMLRSFPHFVYNELGSRWAGFINRRFVWNKTKNRKFPDPTRVNPKLKVRILSGEWEEFVPGPLDETGLPAKVPRAYDVLGKMKQFFSGATTILEPRVGHLVHGHNDANGHDVVLREILAVNGESVADLKVISETVSKDRKTRLSEFDQAIQKQKLEPFFRTWLKTAYGENFLIETLKSKGEDAAIKLGRIVVGDFKKFEDWRSEFVLNDLKERSHPFYLEHQENIDSIIKTSNLNERTQAINAYYIYLSQTPERQKNDVVTIDLVAKWKSETNWDRAQRLQVENIRPDLRTNDKNKKNSPQPARMCIKFYQSA